MVYQLFDEIGVQIWGKGVGVLREDGSGAVSASTGVVVDSGVGNRHCARITRVL